MIDDITQKVLAKMTEEARKTRYHREAMQDAWNTAEEILGYPGRMLSGSKIAPTGQRIIWNSNICTKEHGKIWFGDFNVTKELNKLIDLAFKLNSVVYVLYEMDARFDNELTPEFDNAVVYVDQHGGSIWDDHGNA